MRPLWVIGCLALGTGRAMAQVPDCASGIEHVADPSVAYQPSPDTVPADLPGSSHPYGPEDRIVMGLRVDSKVAPQTKALAVRPEIYAGTVEVKPQDGAVTMNGRPLSPPPCPKP